MIRPLLFIVDKSIKVDYYLKNDMRENFFKNLKCTLCGASYSPEKPHNLCQCGAPLFARYEIGELKKKLERNSFDKKNLSIWRYKELLPLQDEKEIVSLGEGFTPLIQANDLAEELKIKKLLIKDESQNPTSSFKARGMSAAVSMAKKYGIKDICLPSAGNAASALSAYCAEAKIAAHIFVPEKIEPEILLECRVFGSDIRKVKGAISDCANAMQNDRNYKNWFDLSTLKEPYRIEGKKTMGYELAEQLNWKLPDVIIYPTGGGTGLIGMWKGFDELEKLGFIDKKRPRMISVQSEGCAPIVKAFQQGKEISEFWENSKTIASGINVPKALGDLLILKVLRESKGSAVSVKEEEILKSIKDISQSTGIFPCPEGAATLAGLKKLKQKGLVREDDLVVLFNTASGLKYVNTLKPLL